MRSNNPIFNRSEEFHSSSNAYGNQMYAGGGGTTVGFGDVSASGQAARVLVTVQILFNLAFFGLTLRAFGVVVQHRTGGAMPAALEDRRPPRGDGLDAPEP